MLKGCTRCAVLCVLFIVLPGCQTPWGEGQAEDEQVSTLPEAFTPNINYEKAARLNAELGILYLEKGQVTRAKAKLVHAEKLAPELPEVQYSFGFFWETIGELKLAEEAYRRAITLKGQEGESHNNYGTFLCRHGRHAEADKHFAVAINDRAYVRMTDALENAGLCRLDAGDFAGAQRYLERAVRQDPKRPLAWLELAHIYYETGAYEKARESFQRYDATPQETTKRALTLKLNLATYFNEQNKAASAALLLRSLYPESQSDIQKTTTLN